MHPTTGRYDLEAARLDSSYKGDLPHMSHRQACLAPTGLPETIGNQDDLFQLRDAIGRCYTRVHMNSLLCPLGTWSSEVRRAAPEAVITFWDESHRGRDIPRNDAGGVDPEYFHADRVIPVTEERRATWDLGRLNRPTTADHMAPTGTVIAAGTVIPPDVTRRPDETALEYMVRLDVRRAANLVGNPAFPPLPTLTPEQTAAAVGENEANEAEGEEEGDDGPV